MAGKETRRLLAAVVELLHKAGVPYRLDPNKRGEFVLVITPPATSADALEARLRKLAELAKALD